MVENNKNIFRFLNKINKNVDFIKFRESHLSLAFKIITIIGLLIVASWHFIDHKIDIDNKQSVFFLRLACIIFYITSLFLSYFIKTRKFIKFLLITGFYVSVVYSSLLANFTGGVESPYWFGLNFIIIAWLLFVPFGFIEMIINSILFIVLYSSIIILSDIDSINWQLFTKNNFIYIETFLMGGGIALLNNKRLASIYENERIIKENEKKFRLLNQNMHDVVWILNMNTRKFTYVSPSVIKLRGYTPEEVMQQTIEESLTPESYLKANELLEKMIADFHESGKTDVLMGELEQKCKDGSTVWIEIVASFILDDNNGIKEILGVSRNINERKKAEKALKESEEKYRYLINKALDGIIITQNGKYQLVNPAFCEMTGYSENELIGMNFIDMVAEDDRQLMIDVHTKRMKGEGFPLIYNAKGIRKDGSILHMELNSTTIEYNGKPAAFIILRDQTQNKHAEQALRESEEKYKALVEKANDGIVILQDGYVRFINQMMAEILGYEVKSMINTPFIDYLSDEEKPKVLNFYHLRQQGKEVPTIYETVLIDKWGNQKPVEFNNSIITYNGKIATQTYIRDISERKKSELLLKESEEKFRTLTSSAMDAILMINNLGQITYWNDASEKIFGYKTEEVLFKDLHDIITPAHLREEYRLKLMQYAQGEIELPKDKNLELIAVRKNGTEFIYELSLSSFSIKEKWNGVGIIRDITNRLKTEEELRKSKEILQNVNLDLEQKIEERTLQLTNAKTQLLRLQKENLQSQFEMLKNQVNPHFLFNSLNVLISLIKLEPDTAELFTEQLSKVYRYVLENKEKDLVSLKVETNFLKAYVYLLEIRFRDKLKINIDLPEEKLGLQLPPIALQLLIENAIKHNTFSKKNNLIIDIFIDDDNYLHVINNLQIRENRIESTGVGLKNIETRYSYLTDKKISYGIKDDKFEAIIPLL